MKHITRGNVNPQGKQKVYFSCHKQDKHLLEEISNDILSLLDLAIFYTDDEQVDLENLKLMQLIVFPVTKKFIYEDNSSRLIDLKNALDNNIPILPLIQEEGLEFEFNKICGDIQCLNKLVKDHTQISFEKKLNEFLNSIFVNENLKRKVEEAFDGSIFLSYRKKDRKEAKKVMDKIHSFEELQSLSIWYDEYLIPGEDYSDNIEDEIKKCSLFVMVITPSLLEENNYVLTVEYPLAKKFNKKIIPILAVDTDYYELQKMYFDIPNYCCLEQEISKIVYDFRKKDTENYFDDNEKNYLLGLAYLSGINVEVNVERGIYYLEKASKNNHINARQKLASIYFDGILVKEDKTKAIELIKSAAPLSRLKYAKERTEENFIFMIESLQLWGRYLFEEKMYELSKMPYFIIKTECIVAKKHFSNQIINECLVDALISLGDIEFCLRNFEEARKYHEEAYDLLVKNNKLDDSYLKIVNLCRKLSNDCYVLGDMKFMRVYIEARVSVLQLYLKNNDSFEVLKMYYQSLCELGEVFYKEGDYKKASELLIGSINGIKEAYSKSHLNDYLVQSFFDSAYAYFLLSKIRIYEGNYIQAKNFLMYLENGYTTLFKNDLSKCASILYDIKFQYGSILIQERKFDEAINKFKDALIIIDGYIKNKSLSDIDNLIHIYQSICQCYLSIDDYDNAVKYMNKFMPLVKEYSTDESLGSLQNIFVSSTLIASICKKQNQIDVVEKALINALDAAIKMNKKETSIVRFIDLIKSYSALGDFYVEYDKNKSLYYYEKVYNSSKRIVDKTNDLEILHLTSLACNCIVYFYKNDLEKVKDIIDTGIIANKRWLEFINDENKEIALADFYFLKATIDKENIDVNLLNECKKIYLKHYENIKDDNILKKLEFVENVKKILEEN